jgi:hypothetical protein
MSAINGETTHTKAAQLIADNLSALPHPGTDEQARAAVSLRAFRTTGMPPQMTTHIKAATKLIGESVVHLLRTNGIELIDAGELERLRATDPNQPPPRSVSLQCPHGHTLIEIVPRPTIRLRTTQLRALVTAAKCKH